MTFCGGAPLVTKPLAPAWIIASKISRLSCIERPITRTFGCCRCNRRVASMPFSRGIVTSMRTTSGARLSARSIASSPSDAWPTTSISEHVASSATSPARTMRWSSAIRTRRGRRGTDADCAGPARLAGAGPGASMDVADGLALAPDGLPLSRAPNSWSRTDLRHRGEPGDQPIRIAAFGTRSSISP